MARLRKPSPAEQPMFMLPPPATAQPTRSSPRKAVRESASVRKLRYTSPEEEEDSLLVPKASANKSPVRKQRVLRPIGSNASLVRRPSSESLRSLAATPEKDRRPRRPLEEGVHASNHLYSRTLARSLARYNKGTPKSALGIMKSIEMEEPIVHEDDVDKSVICVDEVEVEEDEDKENAMQLDEESEEDEDEDPIVDLNMRRRQPRARRIVSDSEDDEYSDAFEIPATQVHTIKGSMPPPPPPTSSRPQARNGHSRISNWAQDVIDLTIAPEQTNPFTTPSLPPLPPPVRARSASFAASSHSVSKASNDEDGILVYSPTPKKHRSPRKAPPVSRPTTPEELASPTKLVSPSKKNKNIPKMPALRPSIDAFWDPEVINDHTDKHSPSKPLVSPRKQKMIKLLEKQMTNFTIFDDESDSLPSPTTSPRKQSQSSSKEASSDDATPTVAELRAQRKDFAARKHALAETFLTELDTKIADGRITELSHATGGIKLIWSKTLKTTAGRANWRREQIRLRTGVLPSDTRTEIRHHCSIELAEKVIDDSERLYNVLAHEFCHLTTFMISEVRNNPHGAEFKSWGAKATRAFRHLGVDVTTKHSYKIDYKYVWACVACGYEFKRHSKSIDPAKHSCGRCKGRLLQTKPAPRGGAVGKDGKKEKSEYQLFVQDNFARVKSEMAARGESTQMGKVMESVAREYRERKAARAAKDVDDVGAVLEGLKI